jgi:glucose/arabinose dehydrogenase
MKTIGTPISLLAALFVAQNSFAAEGHGGDGAHSKVPAPEASAAEVPDGYKVEVFLSGLTFPTSIEFGADGDVFVAESGYTYGDAKATPRVIRYDKSGERKGEISDGLVGPVNDLLWHDEKLFISHRGKISVIENTRIKDLVTGLPSDGDHQNNQIVAGPDGMLYFGQGVATNSGVVGLDNANMGWLKKHPDFHDVSAKDIKLTGETFTTENPLTSDESVKAVTSAFQPFAGGKNEDGKVAGHTKAGGTILRMRPDGSDLEVFAWGLRNPYGLSFSGDALYATENGFDARGSRPIANDKEDLYKIEEGAWYGWPDFGSGIPVTDPQFKPEDKPQPQFLMAAHPDVMKPLATYAKHSSITKMAISPGGAFAEKGKIFIAFFGHMAPMTGEVEKHGGHRVIMVDPASFESSDFLTQKHHSQSGEGDGKSGHHKTSEEKSSDGNAASAGPRRLLDVQFSPEGDSLYVVDYGVMFVDKDGITPKPETGVVWRIRRDGN